MGGARGAGTTASRRGREGSVNGASIERLEAPFPVALVERGDGRAEAPLPNEIEAVGAPLSLTWVCPVDKSYPACAHIHQACSEVEQRRVD